MKQEKKVYWVYGNAQTLVIPLEEDVIPSDGEPYAAPFFPSADATVTVNLVGRFRKYAYTPVVDGNLLMIRDGGTLPTGCYGVEVLVDNHDGTFFRSQWDDQIAVTTQNDTVLREWDEFRRSDAKARAALFFFARGGGGSGSADALLEQLEQLAARVSALEDIHSRKPSRFGERLPFILGGSCPESSWRFGNRLPARIN